MDLLELFCRVVVQDCLMSSGSDGLFDACFLILLFFEDSLWSSIT